MMDCTSLFAQLDPRERTKERIEIEAPDYTYLPEGEISEGWLPNVLRGFSVYKSRGTQVQTAAIVGCGPGVDAVLMIEILNPRTLILTDVDSKIVEVAKRNVNRNCNLAAGQTVEARDGDLCEGLLSRGLPFDVIYENLPNLPAQSSINVKQGSLSASFFESSGYDPIPDLFGSNRLSLHYEFLRQAKRYLKKGGDVLCCIGARVPVKVILEMFESLDYSPEVLVHGLVRQFEAERVLAEYSRAEAETEKEFRFFDLDATIPVFQKLTDEGLGTVEFMEQLAKEAPAISAEEAAWRHGLGGHVGHVGLMIRGSFVGSSIDTDGST
jgi:methylase of polypeptide subunit release factors